MNKGIAYAVIFVWILAVVAGAVGVFYAFLGNDAVVNTSPNYDLEELQTKIVLLDSKVTALESKFYSPNQVQNTALVQNTVSAPQPVTITQPAIQNTVIQEIPNPNDLNQTIKNITECNAYYKTVEDKMDDLKDKQDEKGDDKINTQSDISKANSELAAARASGNSAEISRIEDEIDDYERELRQINKDINDYDDDITELQDKLYDIQLLCSKLYLESKK